MRVIDGTNLYRRVQIGFGPAPSTGQFGVNELVYLHTGQTYSLAMTADAQTNVHYEDGGADFASASASVDPTFAIQREYADSYHFVGLPASSLVSPPIPEPDTWAVMIAGACLVGPIVHRNRPASRHLRSASF